MSVRSVSAAGRLDRPRHPRLQAGGVRAVPRLVPCDSLLGPAPACIDGAIDGGGPFRPIGPFFRLEPWRRLKPGDLTLIRLLLAAARRGPRPRLNEYLITRLLVRLALAGRLPRMESFDWQVLHGHWVEETEELGLHFDAAV